MLRSALLLTAIFVLMGCTTTPADDGGAGSGGFVPGPLAGAGAGGAPAGGAPAGGASGGAGTGAPTGGGGAGAGGAPAGGAGGAPAGGAGGAPAGGAGGAGAGGAGGAGAGGGGGAGAGGGELAMCITDVMAGGRDMTCASCLCMQCGPELTAVDGDAKADAMLTCIGTNNCQGQCCLCGAPCDALGGNYATGPCAMQIETAAGVTPGAGALTNGAMVTTACDPTMSPATNSCGNAARLGECLSMKCMTECPSTAPACM